MDMNNLFIIKQDILYKLLSIGYIKISDFGVIIFDECHLCEGNHHYNLIMQEFYFYYISNRINIPLPNIIGFTNSNFKDKAITKSKNKEKK
jgi:ATP-dependent RNA helicase DDX58